MLEEALPICECANGRTILDRVFVFLTRADADDLAHVEDENFSVPDVARACGADDRIANGVHLRPFDNDIKCDLREEVDVVFRSPIDFLVSLLASKSLCLERRHSCDPLLLERVADGVQTVGLDDGSNQFHTVNTFFLRFKVCHVKCGRICPQPHDPLDGIAFFAVFVDVQALDFNFRRRTKPDDGVDHETDDERTDDRENNGKAHGL